ncbi:MAG: hypothetical protein ABSC30_15965 [Acidimicrobiales bacterium]|jgi:hypothetical protein
MKPRTNHRKIRLLMVLAVASALGGGTSLVVATGAAQADPPSTTGLVAVGADVTQDLFDAYTGASPPPGLSGNTQATTFYTPLHSSDATDDFTIQSFDASPFGGTTTAPGCITTKTGGPSFDRPNSTTNGIAALYDETVGTAWVNPTPSQSCTGTAVSVTGQIDFARAARGVKTTGTTLTFIPYARDALGILRYDHGDGVIDSLTSAQLTTLYTSTNGKLTVGADTVYACLTISGSTPRSNLESALGITDAQASAAATAAGCNNITQNSGNAFYSGLPSAVTSVNTNDAVIPISSGSWESQANLVAVDRSATARTNGVDLAAITDGSTPLGQPYTGTAPNEVPNTTYYSDTAFGYNLFTVVPSNKISGFTQNLALESLFVGSGSALCSSTAQTTAHTFGFDSLTVAEGTCGSTSATGNG